MIETHSLKQAMQLHSTPPLRSRPTGTDRGPGIVLAFRVAIHGHGREEGLRVPEVLPGPAIWPSIDRC